MKKSPFKWFQHWDFNKTESKDPIIYVVTEEILQEYAESLIERRLTEVEMNRAVCIFVQNLDVIRLIDDVLKEVVALATNKNIQWADLDEGFLEKEG